MEDNDKNKIIPEIPEIPEAIKHASRSGRFVVFIGAGVSRIIGCPSWEGFAHVYLDYIRDKGKINFFEYEQIKLFDSRKIISICKKIIDVNAMPLPDLKKIFISETNLEKTFPIYKSIYELNAIYITTNYDEFLDNVASVKEEDLSIDDIADKSIPKSGKKNNVIFNYNDFLISDLDNGMVFHIHGSVNAPEKIVATMSDYMCHYVRDSKLDVFLNEIFCNHTVLFIGYGLEEFEILEYLIQKHFDDPPERNYHYMLQPFFQNEFKLYEYQKDYYNDLGVEVIPYAIDKNGYPQLFDIVKEWAKQLRLIAKPKQFLQKISIIDEVL